VATNNAAAPEAVHHAREQRQAVGGGPLEVADEQDHPTALARRTSSVRRAAKAQAQLLRIEDRLRGPASAGTWRSTGTRGSGGDVAGHPALDLGLSARVRWAASASTTSSKALNGTDSRS
jgi:hypothetical protein